MRNLLTGLSSSDAPSLSSTDLTQTGNDRRAVVPAALPYWSSLAGGSVTHKRVGCGTMAITITRFGLTIW